MIDLLADTLSLRTDPQDFYRSAVMSLGSVKAEDVPEELGPKLAAFLDYMDPQEICPEDFGARSFSDLPAGSLIAPVRAVLKSVTYNQKDELLLLKYSKAIWECGWNRFALRCRGKVINMKTREIVSYPFDKFFNLNEVSSTSEEKVEKALAEADEVTVTDKIDGSMIAVSRYKGKLLVTTNGEFNNIQIDLANALIDEMYPKFRESAPEGFTFIFELVHPGNKIIIDYGNEKALYLLGVRDLTTKRLMRRTAVEGFAREYGFKMPASFDPKDLEDFKEEALTAKGAGREGWVFLASSERGQFMFKLKFAEYFTLAKIKAIPSLQKVYVLIQNDMLDDMLAVSEGELLEKLIECTQAISEYFVLFDREIRECWDEFSRRTGARRGNMTNEELGRLAAFAKGSPFMQFVMRYARGYEVKSLEDLSIPPKAFEKMCAFIDAKTGKTA